MYVNIDTQIHRILPVFCFAFIDVIQHPDKYTFMKNRDSNVFYTMYN